MCRILSQLSIGLAIDIADKVKHLSPYKNILSSRNVINGPLSCNFKKELSVTSLTTQDISILVVLIKLIAF